MTTKELATQGEEMRPAYPHDEAGVYLLHASKPLAHSSHYVGYADSVADRVIDHDAGRGAKFTRALVENGASLKLVRVWYGANRHFERLLHNRNGLNKLCPICRANAKKARRCSR